MPRLSPESAANVLRYADVVSTVRCQNLHPRSLTVTFALHANSGSFSRSIIQQRSFLAALEGSAARHSVDGGQQHNRIPQEP